MKRMILYFCTVVMFLNTLSFSLPTKVSAASAYVLYADGEIVNYDTNFSTVYYEDGNLVLNNYNGGQLVLTCGGTCIKDTLKVKLIGNNAITVEDSVGIIASNHDLEFVGDGKLTITAPIPIAYEIVDSYEFTQNNYYVKLSDIGFDKLKPWSATLTINPINENSNSCEIKNTTDEITNTTENITEEKQDFLSSDLFKIIALSYCGVSLIIIIILIIKLISKRKKM